MYRLVSVTLSSAVGRPADGSGLTLHSVSGLDAGTLADRGRWRASVSAGAQVPQLTASSAGLSIVLGRGVARSLHPRCHPGQHLGRG